MNETRECVGNIHVPFDIDFENDFINEISNNCKGYILTREVGDSGNEHYHFHLEELNILPKSLKDKLLKKYKTKLKEYHQSKTTKDSNKAIPRLIEIKEIVPKKPQLSYEEESEIIRCYVYKDIELQQYIPKHKNMDLKTIQYRKERYYELLKIKEDLKKTKSKQKQKENKEFIPKCIEAIREQHTTVGADGNPVLGKVTLLDCIEYLTNYYTKREKILNPNSFENQVISIWIHFSKEFKYEFMQSIEQRIKEKYR